MTRPNTRRSDSEQDQLETKIRRLFEEQITFNQFLGFKVLALDETVQISFDMRPELIGHFLHGRLHGGVISAVLDATGGLAVMWAIAEFHNHESSEQTLERFAQLGTIDLRVDYLRQGIGTRFIASSSVKRLGKRIASTQMELVNEEGKLLSTGAATYIVN